MTEQRIPESVHRIASPCLALPCLALLPPTSLASQSYRVATYASAHSTYALHIHTGRTNSQPPARMRAGKTDCKSRTVGAKDGELDSFGVSERDSHCC
jgi:hypothetical protein